MANGRIIIKIKTMKYSTTMAGLVGAVALPVLLSFGLSETCAGEVWTFIAPLPGIILAWYGRYQAGGVTVLGVRK